MAAFFTVKSYHSIRANYCANIGSSCRWETAS
jgi:hypothetical protein